MNKVFRLVNPAYDMTMYTFTFEVTVFIKQAKYE